MYRVNKSADTNILTQLKDQPAIKEAIFADIEKQLRTTLTQQYNTKMEYLKRNLYNIDYIVRDSIAQDSTLSQVYISILRYSYVIHIQHIHS